MLTEIIVSGFGGQGVLFAGKCLAYSALQIGACSSEELHISWLPSYGPEMRGGTANCSVCLSDEPIGSPLVTEPDILIAMNDPSVERFSGSVKPGGKVFLDSSMASAEISRTDVEVFRVPASQAAQDNGLSGMGNIVLLGKVLKECSQMLGGIVRETVEKAFHEIIPAARAALIEKNIAALNIGMGI